MEKKNIDWSNLGFGYIKTDKRYVANFTNGKWDDGTITEDDMIVMSVPQRTNASFPAAQPISPISECAAR